MAPGVFWIAFSERERQRALDVARALQQRESRDELGVGSVRDALADLLFPGTSTIQTRARYFLFVPWTFKASAAAPSPADVHRQVERSERRLIHALVANCPRGEPGIIGRQAGDDLQRLPSSVYWQGLGVWGIRQLDGSQAVIERALWRARKGGLKDENNELVADPLNVWNPQLPPIPNGYPDTADVELTFDEADFLLQSLATKADTTGSMLALLADHHGGGAAIAGSGQAWLYPRLGELPTDIRHAVEQGRRFSLLMRGAARIYNVILAELDSRGETEAAHRGAFDRWTAAASSGASGLADWDLRELWSIRLRSRVPVTLGARVPGPTSRFVADWLRFVQRGPIDRLVDDSAARQLVIGREQRLKRGNARTVNKLALKQWSGDSGTSPLDFRWGVTRTLLTDIHRGLERRRAGD